MIKEIICKIFGHNFEKKLVKLGGNKQTGMGYEVYSLFCKRCSSNHEVKIYTIKEKMYD